MAATARVHRGDQLDPRGKCDVRVGARDADISRLERLAERIEHGALKLRQLVEEQNTKVCQADLAGAHTQSAADERRHRGAVMRRAKRALAPDLPAAELPGDRCDHRDFERLGGLQGREDAGQTCREQRFARSGRAAHQQVMSARCRDLERALGDFLSLDLGEVGPGPGRLRLDGRRRPNQRRSFEMGEQGKQIGRRDDVQLPSPGGLASLRRRADQPLVGRGRMDRGEEYPWRCGDSPVEAQLADRDIMRQRLSVRGSDRCQQT